MKFCNFTCISVHLTSVILAKTTISINYEISFYITGFGEDDYRSGQQQAPRHVPLLANNNNNNGSIIMPVD